MLKGEKKIFYGALFATVILHLLAVLFLLLWGVRPVQNQFKPLAVMDFAYYDPDGGSGGSEDGEDFLDEGNLEKEVKPEPELEPEPELVPEETEVIESVSEKAIPKEPTPKIKEKVKEKPSPKKIQEKPQRQPNTPVPSSKNTGDASALGTGNSKGQGGSDSAGSGQGNPDALKAYMGQISKKLVRSKKYPLAARKQNQEGTASITFTVDRQGNVISSRLQKSSGHQILDDEVSALIKRVSPFPKMPKEIPDSTITLTVPLVFSLKN